MTPTDPALGVVAALVLGLASSGHCLGMCGPVAAALGAVTEGRGRWHRSWLLVATGLGRIALYASIGAAGGGVVGAVGQQVAPHAARSALAVAASVVLAALALRLLGAGGGGPWLERAGAVAWRRVAPLARRLVPVRTTAQALAAGAVWGLLPCGLVYGAALWAATAGDALAAAAYMVCFGAGTLPAVLGSAALAAWVASRPRWRRGAGAVLLAVAVASAGLALWPRPRSADHAGTHAARSSPPAASSAHRSAVSPGGRSSSSSSSRQPGDSRSSN